MLNVGIIGCGGIGRLHANAYSKLKDVNLLALIDTDIGRAEALAAEFGGTAYPSLDGVREKLDIVSVVTPPAAHFDIVMDLLDRGIAVFCEKPLTMDVSQAKAIEKRSNETKIPVGIGFKMRYEPIFQRAKELVPELGKIFAVSAVKNQPFDDDPNRQWIKKTGCMYELSVHDYDLIHWILNTEPAAVRAELDYSLGWERENQAYLTVDYFGGIKGQLMSSYSTGTVWTGYDLALSFVGENGYMRIERPDRIVMNTNGYRVETVEPLGGMDVFVVQMQNFVDKALKKEPYFPNAADGALNTILVEAANRSNKEKKEVLLNDM